MSYPIEEDFSNLEIQNRSIKKNYNIKKKELERKKEKLNKTLEFIFETKNENLISDYLIHMNGKIQVSHIPKIIDYTNKQKETYKIYVSEYNNWIGKVSDYKTPPFSIYYDSFEENYDNLDYNEETGRFELNVDKFETKEGNYLKLYCKEVGLTI